MAGDLDDAPDPLRELGAWIEEARERGLSVGEVRLGDRALAAELYAERDPLHRLQVGDLAPGGPDR